MFGSLWALLTPDITHCTIQPSFISTMTKDLVLVTGASGFIAKHTIHQLLQADYRVRGSVRNDEEATIAETAFTNNDTSSSQTDFSLVRADLTSDDGWKKAVRDCRYVLHIASPFPLDGPADREALVPISREGTLRVVEAALEETSVQRIIMVSSIVSVLYWESRPQPVLHVKETDWTDPDWKKVTWSYVVAKTRAEKAAWELVRELDVEDKLVSVNPGMVWGPLFDDVESTSSDICKLYLNGAYPFNIPISQTMVDVRDVAAVLVAAIKAPVGGRRLIATSDTLSFTDLGNLLAKSFPQFASKVPTRTAPKWLIRFLALFDSKLAHVLPDLETRPEVDTRYVTELTGVKFRPSSEAVVAMAESLVAKKLV